jgi:hypothetical protein
MMQFPVGNTLFVVLEPGNIRKMREGKPLVLRPFPGATVIGIVSTPDILELERRIKLPTSPEMLSAAIESCKDLPEVDRGAEPDTGCEN